MKRYIGGFLELELFTRLGPGYHQAAIGLQNARACISHIIRQTNLRAVWLPYYTCNALLEPFEAAGIPCQFYSIDECLEISELPVLEQDEYIVYINYFGLKTEYIKQLLTLYDSKLLVDDTQHYFARGYGGGWSFNSARKSFGVPDGGYLYGPAAQIGSASTYPRHTNFSAQHLIDRLHGEQSRAYEGFTSCESTMDSTLLRISILSESLLSQVDYEAIAEQRRANYIRYQNAFEQDNTIKIQLNMSQLPSDTVPFCYPLLTAKGATFDRQTLFDQGIFVACFWPDMLSRIPAIPGWERHLVQDMLPLPVDHRYGPSEIDQVIAAIQIIASKSTPT